jgi:hypothetical protein
VGGPTEPASEAAKVGIDGYPWYLERIPEDDVRSLAPDAGQGHQILHATGDLTTEPLDDRL